MKIEAIPTPSHEMDATEAEVVRLKISGPVDANHEVVRRARELVLGTGLKAMIESFDWALQYGNFTTEE